MKREWVQNKPWYEVHFTVHKGTFSEFDNQVDVQAKSCEDAMKIVQKDNPLIHVWATYKK